MENLWNKEGIPHNGWILDFVTDVGENYATCEMCGNEKVRYVHHVNHEEYGSLRVGCVCCEKMTEDYKTPRRLENKLKSEARRRESRYYRFINFAWNETKNGNFYRKWNDSWTLIYFHPKNEDIMVKVDDDFWNETFETIEEAKDAIFNFLEDEKVEEEE